ncbi:MAG: hypothetical protein GJ676_16190 [Rhodobacteraceae bacterium]|nr:hypothetical protein [Paracoccaceae bacterium]
MDKTTDAKGCAARSWRMAAIGGVVLGLLSMVIGGSGLVWAIIVGAVCWGVLGFALTRILCPEGQVSEATAEAVPSAAAVAEPEAVATPEPVAPEPAEQAGAGLDATPDAVAAVSEPETQITASALVKPSKPLPGQLELASRKGTWKYKGNPSSA